jgi:crossover junction endodeoxyribonuclease RuvC
MSLVILALDPGIGRCGFAVMKRHNSEILALEYGCIETSARHNLEQRLQTIYNELSILLNRYSITKLVLERLFFNTNQKTAITVGQAQGVMLLSAAQKKIPVIFLTPLQIKLAVTGYGKADKTAVKKMLLLSLKLRTVPKLDDTIDALACGLGYLYNHP